jgi:hypothetical protein
MSEARHAPPAVIVRLQREARRRRLMMRTSRDGGYYLIEPFSNSLVLGTTENGVSLDEISRFVEAKGAN